MPIMIIASAFLSAFFLNKYGYGFGNVQFFLAFAFVAIFALLEILFPYKKDWLFYKDIDAKTDSLFFVLNKVVPIPFIFGMNKLFYKIDLDYTLWPTSIPFILQFLLAIVIFDFFYYWFHRLWHTLPFLWTYHSVHHSSEKIHFLKSNRNNVFVEAIPYAIIFSLPFRFLNPPIEVLNWVSFTIIMFSYFVHANIDMKFFRIWDYFLVTSRIHYVHHLKDVNNGIGYNFGALLLIWDQIFGTFKRPVRKEEEVLGIEGNPVNTNLFWLLVYPFKSKKRS